MKNVRYNIDSLKLQLGRAFRRVESAGGELLEKRAALALIGKSKLRTPLDTYFMRIKEGCLSDVCFEMPCNFHLWPVCEDEGVFLVSEYPEKHEEFLELNNL